MTSVYINGLGLLPIDRHYDKSLIQLALEASREALDSAGEYDIDTIIIASNYSTLLQRQSMLASLVAEELVPKGLQVFNVENGGASGLTAVHLARALIKSGLSRSVLVIGVDKQSDYPQSIVNQTSLTQVNYEYHGIMGVSLASLYALSASLYLSKHQLNEEDLALWPVVMHENAVDVPHAQFKFKITVQNVLQSDYISAPIRVLHAHAQADGASAVLLSSNKKESTIATVEASHVVSGKVEYELNEDPLHIEPVEKAVKTVLMQASLDKNLIGLIEVLDMYSIGGPLLLESSGIIPKGETLKRLKEGRFKLGDSVAINLSGGIKGRGFVEGATGVYQIAETAAFLSGYRGYKQQYTDYALAIGVGGLSSVAAVVLVKRI
jgi:acetyl-CoA C-acetyltransferase